MKNSILSTLLLVSLFFFTSSNNPKNNPRAKKLSQMSLNEVINFIYTDSNKYWQSIMYNNGLRYAPPHNFKYYNDRKGTHWKTTCGSTRNQIGNAFYCPSNHSIYYDYTLLQNVYNSANNSGDAAVAVILAHEFSHLAQRLYGIAHHKTKPHELQADCWAGAYFKSLEDRGILEQGDAITAANQLFGLGDWNIYNEQHHGIPAERYTAFANGFNYGFASCGY